VKLTYRPEIDGLRAIAIIFIILSHFKQLNFVSGGVNIFFVISGYLITHIFLNQKLDISKFYKNRFLKLYPSIFIISLITIILFFFIGDFVQWSVILRSFISTIIGLFNFYLIKIGNVYGQENYINPFLPFWAFCVIVQFYIIYPIILKIIFLIKRKFNLNDNFIITSLFILSIISFLFYYYFRDNNLFSFYSPLSRYWQFILGSCLYFLFQSKKKLYFKNLTIYFAVILIIIWQLNFEWFYAWRKVQILLTISTLLFLYSTNTNFFNKILSIKPLTLLGKVSFELYLIHMSVIYFISLWFEQGVVILSLILLVIVTYFFIKFFNQYLLQKINFIFSNKLIIFSSIIFILINLSVYFYDKNSYLKTEVQFKNAFSSINFLEKIKIDFENTYEDSAETSYFFLRGKDNKFCFDRTFGEEFIKNCTFIDIENDKNFFLIGGSHISSFGYNLKQRLKNFTYSHFSRNNHIYLPGFDRIDKKENKKNEDFSKYNNFARKTLLSVKNETIVLIGANYPLFLNKTIFNNKEGGVEGDEGKEWDVMKFEHSENSNIKWQYGFKNSVEELLTNKNIKVILVYPIPAVGFSIIKKLENYKFFSNNLLNTSFDVFKERTKSSFELLDSIQDKNIYRVYPHTMFCNTTIKDRCISHDDKNVFYSDGDHLSLKGAEMVNDLIMKEIEKIELKSN
jgi:peptidoglycan/LPS O-acetylase OafA/YrhL